MLHQRLRQWNGWKQTGRGGPLEVEVVDGLGACTGGGCDMNQPTSGWMLLPHWKERKKIYDTERKAYGGSSRRSRGRALQSSRRVLEGS